MNWRIECGFLLTGNKREEGFPDGRILVEDGRIVWAGARGDPWQPAPSGAFATVHAEDMTVIPGLINCHGHGSLNVLRGISDATDFTVWARELSPHTSKLTERDLDCGNALSVMEMLASGTTCACDCTRFGVGRFTDVAAAFGMRSVAGGLCNSPEYRADGDENFPDAVAGIEQAAKIHQGDPLARFHIGAHSSYNCTPELIRQAFGVAVEKNLPFVIHAAETQTEEQTIQQRYGMRPIEWLDSLGVLDRRTVLVHGVWLDGSDIERISRAGCKVVHCPVSNAKLRSGTAEIRRLKDAGITVGIGTDSMLSNNSLDLLAELKTAALADRMTSHLAPLTNGELFAMATRDAARVLGMEQAIGSIESGKRADIVFLNAFHPLAYDTRRLLSDLVFYMNGSHVSKVMVDGKFVYSDGVFTQVNAAEMKQQIQEFYKKGDGQQ